MRKRGLAEELLLKLANGEEEAGEEEAGESEYEDEEGGVAPGRAAVSLFLLENPEPTDDDFHAWCEEHGFDVHAAEEVAYQLAAEQAELESGGKSEGELPEDLDPEQLDMGIEVEKEHTSSPQVAAKIAIDHLTEDPQYYTALKEMEDRRKAEMESEEGVEGSENNGDSEGAKEASVQAISVSVYRELMLEKVAEEKSKKDDEYSIKPGYFAGQEGAHRAMRRSRRGFSALVTNPELLRDRATLGLGHGLAGAGIGGLAGAGIGALARGGQGAALGALLGAGVGGVGGQIHGGSKADREFLKKRGIKQRFAGFGTPHFTPGAAQQYLAKADIPE